MDILADCYHITHVGGMLVPHPVWPPAFQLDFLGSLRDPMHVGNASFAGINVDRLQEWCDYEELASVFQLLGACKACEWIYILISCIQLLGFEVLQNLACRSLSAKNAMFMLFNGSPGQYMTHMECGSHQVLRANDDRGHLFCWFPHGVFAFGWMAASGTEDYFFPDREVSGIAGSSVFHIPLFRHISAWLGGYPATRKNINRLLEKGRSVTFLSVGGMAEMFLTSDRNKEKVRASKCIIAV